MIDTIKDKVKKILFSPQYLSGIEKSKEVQSFVLSYKEKDIGYLNFNDNKWTFYYSDWFKSQNNLVPLLEFPKKEKIYESSDLWPFFASRIPSKLNRGESYSNKDNDSVNIADLLKNFGRRTVNNPFVLTPA